MSLAIMQRDDPSSGKLVDTSIIVGQDGVSQLGTSDRLVVPEYVKAMLAPGVGSPRIPDGYTTYCLPKYFPISVNINTGDGSSAITDMIVYYDFYTDRSTIGYVYTISRETGAPAWSYQPLRVSGDLT